MWHLKSIRANNLCSFLEMEYRPKQGAATLIFGNNLDSDSQNSNGSGKSALIEAIAISLTGEPLRKVNADEIINDTQDEAVISAVLMNEELGVQMTINRRLSRKQPQQIQVLRQTGPYDDDVEEIAQASVLDYNKYILDQLGLTKDDIFANFILTARKYKSFLSSSDKEKKEIINRFSNGVLVDESIEALQSDIAPVQEEMNEAEKLVATCTGRVEALATEIEKAINESAERKSTNESRIQNWEKLIADKRADIRKHRENIQSIEDSLDGLDVLDEEMQALEKEDKDAMDSLSVIAEKFKTNDLALTTNYVHEIENFNGQLKVIRNAVNQWNIEIVEIRKNLDEAEKTYKRTYSEIEKKQGENEKDQSECADRIEKLMSSVDRLRKKATKLSDSQMSTNQSICKIKNQLAGVIECPKCHHEFVLNAQLDIEAARENLTELKNKLAQLSSDITKNQEEYNKVVADGKNQREIQNSLQSQGKQLARDLRDAEEAITKVRNECSIMEKNISDNNELISEIEGKISKIRKRIFDDVFDTIDSAYKRRENQIKDLSEEISTLEGSIASYEKAIEEARNASEEDVITSLKNSRAKYQEELQEAISAKNKVEGRLNELKDQEATFIEFKTYLANTKINAIAQIMNEFLDAIGSDIRVSLSGYTILKSGKVRDKISVSLLRDGVDCGSFEKFSAGERVRVELASILSMNKLTNMNCEDGKGLDLLIADEVLDSADEQGLASVFKALNKSQITSLVVSHGQVHESYPNKITVQKCNGVSSIYDTENN